MPYKTRKDRRKEYTGSKAVDKTCRSNGGCPWCEGNRLHKHKKREKSADEQLEDYEKAIDSSTYTHYRINR